MLVQALKEHKKTVAMTGDGVNDVLALKDADCSVAMASGSEAASNVAQLVLLDSDFSRMPSVVAEGRRVVNNIERTAALYIVKNIFSMLLAIFSVILMLDYPLEPRQASALEGAAEPAVPAAIFQRRHCAVFPDSTAAQRPDSAPCHRQQPAPGLCFAPRRWPAALPCRSASAQTADRRRRKAQKSAAWQPESGTMS